MCIFTSSISCPLACLKNYQNMTVLNSLKYLWKTVNIEKCLILIIKLLYWMYFLYIRALGLLEHQLWLETTHRSRFYYLSSCKCKYGVWAVNICVVCKTREHCCSEHRHQCLPSYAKIQGRQLDTFTGVKYFCNLLINTFIVIISP